MSLSAALNTAKSSLAASQVQTAVVSSNIANVNTPGATRKVATVVSGLNGTVSIRSISQSSNAILFRNMLDATSQLSRASAQGDVLARLNEIVGDTSSGQSPQSRIAALNDALNSLANTPGNYDLARAAVQAAQDMVRTLNDNATAVSTIRRDADNQLSAAADDMNRILKELESVNRKVVSGTAKNEDVTDLSDQRDQLVAKLSEYVGVSVQTRGSNDMVIYTDSGVTLLESQARTVSFASTHPIVAGQPGNAFYVDGVAVTGANSYMPVKSGLVVGLTEVRDEIAVTYGAQLDEMARGLISAFAEYDQAAGGAARTGLFDTTASISTTMTPAAIGANVDPSRLAAGDTVSFTLTYEGVAYQVSGAVAAGDLVDADAFAARLQSLVAEAKTSSGAALGKGRVGVAAAGTALSLTATGIGENIDVSVSNLNASATAAGLTIGASASGADATYPGLAASLTLAAGLVADPTKVRDGVNYDYNTGNLGGFAGRINALSSALGASRTFSDDARADTKGTLADFASSSVSWLQDTRFSVTKTVSAKETLLAKTNETLSNETGINLDEELTRLLELERSYQASAKIISTVDAMLAQLLQSV